ncbi:MAG: bifunctional tRNA (5-methylaminomethyl-2-thiouridine)(34)-methyltransferase MnmD/FAD-dependent 5-carboxymethylaminomethyl-2-thiouridine(34) oxidoreductase MnmC [Legionella sp.]|nr:bifunctional tRNA (5-methylaminomethyl-2-thiouridine)(34)-methyltransferase MnmD/FAD-dependent 5-carboxymethylaminomethyl-2-thiouridine(34) oxidoreductase MnmC [Legionella sp.]
MSEYFIPIDKAILEWQNGVPYSPLYQDIYHARASGLEQSFYVFIQGNNLLKRWQQVQDQEFVVAETGFGLGLNFLLTAQLWLKHRPNHTQLTYYSCEKNPFSKQDLKKALDLWPELADEAQELLQQYPLLTPGYHILHFKQQRIKLVLMLGEAYSCFEQLLACGQGALEPSLRAGAVDAWYLDGFAPSKNSEMWSSELFKVIALLSKPGATAATYTAASIVKKNLQECGFILEKKKGFAGKRHMLTAYFAPQQLHDLKKKQTPWYCEKKIQHSNKSVILVGGGLAGCFTAHVLAQRGWKVILLEAQSKLGCGASGNKQAVLFPNLSAYASPLTELMLSAFLYAQKIYRPWLDETLAGGLNGTILLAQDEQEAAAHHGLHDWLNHYPELASLCTREDLSALAGVPVSGAGLFIPSSGWIDSHALCERLVQHELITVVTNSPADELEHVQGMWRVNNWEASVVILTAGHQVSQFLVASHLPIKPIRGQMTQFYANSESVELKLPLCGTGHVLPSYLGQQHCGATYELNCNDNLLKQEDDQYNLSRLNALAPQISWPQEPSGQWAGVRATTSDYLPIVGPLPIVHNFKDEYSGLAANSRRWIGKGGSYYPGLYICAGFGSRGLTTIPLCAEWLSGHINQELSILPRKLIQAISPARFLRKNIIRGKN